MTVSGISSQSMTVTTISNRNFNSKVTVTVKKWSSNDGQFAGDSREIRWRDSREIRERFELDILETHPQTCEKTGKEF